MTQGVICRGCNTKHTLDEFKNNRFCRNCGKYLWLKPPKSNGVSLEAFARLDGDREMRMNKVGAKDLVKLAPVLTIYEIGGRQFQFVCRVSPERENSGIIKQFQPQNRYRNLLGVPLHKYGGGSFCRFRIPDSCEQAGVYIVLENEIPKYVGECENLAKRWNAGYGNISPRNCFVRGRETNCRINKLILKSCRQGNKVVLLFCEINEDRKKIEATLRRRLQLEWNRQR